jgi:hypothetical protein
VRIRDGIELIELVLEGLDEELELELPAELVAAALVADMFRVAQKVGPRSAAG